MWKILPLRPFYPSAIAFILTTCVGLFMLSLNLRETELLNKDANALFWPFLLAFLGLVATLVYVLYLMDKQYHDLNRSSFNSWAGKRYGLSPVEKKEFSELLHHTSSEVDGKLVTLFEYKPELFILTNFETKEELPVRHPA